MPDIALTGRLLVAAPTLDDPSFTRTVVLVLDHDEDGALGLVLNRPSEIEVGEVMPEWSPFTAEPSLVFAGGPVTPQAVICLGRALPGVVPEGWTEVCGPLGAVDLSLDVLDVASGLEGLRLFAGYSGWSPGQLEGEIELGGWIVVDAEPADAFSADPTRLWASVLRRQGGELALLHTYPADPSLN